MIAQKLSFFTLWDYIETSYPLVTYDLWQKGGIYADLLNQAQAQDQPFVVNPQVIVATYRPFASVENLVEAYPFFNLEDITTNLEGLKGLLFTDTLRQIFKAHNLCLMGPYNNGSYLVKNL